MKWIMVLLVVMLLGCDEPKQTVTVRAPAPAKPPEESTFVATNTYTVKNTRGDGAYMVVSDGNRDLMLHCAGGYQEAKCKDIDTTADCTEHGSSEDWCHAFKPGEVIQLEVWGHEKIVYHSTTSRDESDYEVQ